MAGDTPIIDNDKMFQKQPSHNQLVKWDLLNDKIQLLTMSPHKKA